MQEPHAILPLRALPPDAPLPLPPPPQPQPQPQLFLVPHPNPNPPPTPTSSRPPHPWEAMAKSWLSGFAPDHTPTDAELDEWVDSHRADLPSLPRSQLHQRILSLRPRDPDQGDEEENLYAYRFQRTDLWKPVYKWLESLDKDSLVSSKEVSEWLSANAQVMERLAVKHSKYHLMHYTQRMHLKLLKKRGKLPKSLQLSAARASVKLGNAAASVKTSITGASVKISNAASSVKINNSAVTTREIQPSGRFVGGTVRDKKLSLSKKKEAFLKYELLTDLENQLITLLKHNGPVDTKASSSSYLGSQRPENNNITKDGAIPQGAITQEVVKIHREQSTSRELSETDLGHKRKRNPIIVTPAWSYSEAVSGASEQSSSSHIDNARNLNIWNGNVDSSLPRRSLRKNILICLEAREKGTSWAEACSYGGYAGRNRERWVSYFEGWHSPGNQFEGPAVDMVRKSHLSWRPTWCAYTSGTTSAQPNGRQGVRKVVDVRFHPEGLPQLVCSTNEAPNELLLFNLLSGRSIQLRGHNSKIQAIDFAVKGASVVSCGLNLLKVWDCITGSCLYTLGGDDRNSVGHTQKINAMAVNKWQSCLVVTSGAKGDGKLLVWNALRGELASDLNANLRSQDLVYPSIDAMEFCNENLLACGSDCDYGGSAVVQLWDMDSPESYLSFSASDSYITSLKINPAGNTLITGSGDGTIGLFDIRTCTAINHLSVGSGYEVTSVSFSSCGTYFCASSTSNNTLVWDTRLIPMNRGRDVSRQNNDMRFFRPLHCLSHGKQMPTAEYTGQLPGHVDEGYQGVNNAHWLHRGPELITVSGDGSIGMWDVTLGRPCVRHITSHARCANAVAVAPNDEYFCTGGDDEKIVLYKNRNGRPLLNWRLSHPLAGND